MAPLPRGAKLVPIDDAPEADPVMAAAIRKLQAQQADAAPRGLESNTRRSLYDEVVPTALEVGQKLRSGLAGVTSNAAPRILAGMESVAGIRPYAEALADYQPRYAEAVRAQPGSNLVGAVLQPSPLGRLRSGSMLGSAGLAAGRSAYAGLNGSLSGYLGADLNPEAQQRAMREGGMNAAEMQTALELVSPVAGKIAPMLREAGGTQFAKAAGYKPGLSNPAKRVGLKMQTPSGEDGLSRLGNDAWDAGLIPIGGSKSSVYGRALDKMESSGAAQRDVISQMDASGLPADANQAARMSMSRLRSEIDPRHGGNLEAAAEAGPAMDLVNNTIKTGELTPTFRALQDLKSGSYKGTYRSTGAPIMGVAKDLKRSAGSGLRQYLEDSADQVGLGDDLRAANDGFGTAHKISELASDAAQREKSHGPSWFAGITAGSSEAANHGPIAGAAAGLGTMAALHVVRTRGNAVAGPMLRLGANVTAGLEGSVNQMPGAAKSLSDYMMSDDEREKVAPDNFSKKTGGG